jgi:hypothetical protein
MIFSARKQDRKANQTARNFKPKNGRIVQGDINPDCHTQRELCWLLLVARKEWNQAATTIQAMLSQGDDPETIVKVVAARMPGLSENDLRLFEAAAKHIDKETD